MLCYHFYIFLGLAGFCFGGGRASPYRRIVFVSCTFTIWIYQVYWYHKVTLGAVSYSVEEVDDFEHHLGLGEYLNY